MPDNLKTLHTNLTEKIEGFNIPYDQFQLDMQDDEKLKSLHSNLTEKMEGFNVPYEQFKSDMQVKKKEPSEVISELPTKPSPEDFQEEAPTSILDLLKEGKDEEIGTFVGELSPEDLRKPERKEVIGEELTPEKIDPELSKEIMDVLPEIFERQDKSKEERIAQRKAIIDEQIPAIEDRLNDLEGERRLLATEAKEWAQDQGMFAIMPQEMVNERLAERREIERKEAYLRDAKDMLKRTQKYVETADAGVFETAFKGTLAKDFFTFGLNSITEDIDLIKVAKKIESGGKLTEEEELSLYARGMQEEMMSDVEQDLWAMVGSGVVSTIPFMVEFAATGGLSATGKAAGKKAVRKILKEQADKKVGKYLQKGIGALTGAITRTPAMTDFYEGIPREMVGNVRLSQDGVSGEFVEDTKKTALGAVGKSFASTATTTLVEDFGKVADGLIAKAGIKFPKSPLSGKIKNKSLKKLSEATGMQGFVGEFTEEIIDGYAQAAIEGEGLSGVFTGKELLATGLTVFAFQGARAGLDYALKGDIKGRKQIVNNLNNSEQSLQPTTVVEIDRLLQGEDVDKNLEQIDIYIKEKVAEGANDEDVANIIDYVENKTAMSALEKSESAIIEEQISEEEAKVEQIPTEVEKVAEKPPKVVKKEELPPKEEVEKPKVEEGEVDLTIGGKKRKVKLTDVHLTNKGASGLKLKEGVNNLVIKTKHGNIGQLILHRENGVNTVGFSQVDLESNRGKGIGSYSYELLANELQNKYNENLVSGTTRTQDAESMWKSLEKRGVAVKKVNADGDSYYETIKKEVKPKVKEDEKVVPETRGKEGVREEITEKKSREGEEVSKEEVLEEKPRSGIKEAEKVDIIPERAKEAVSAISLETTKVKESSKVTAGAIGKAVETKEIKSDGKKIGEVQAGMFENDIRMNNIRIEPEFKGKGFRKQAYKNLNEEANERGGILVSSETMSQDAENVWKSLVKEGVAEKVGDIYKFKTKEDAKKLEGEQVRVEGEPIKEQKVSDKDLPKIDGTELQDRAKVEIEKKIGKIEKLDQKRKESVQKGLDSLGRLGNLSFALDEAGKKQAIQDIATAVKEFTKAGVISAEMGTLKAIDFVKNQLKSTNPNSEKFIEDNRQAIQETIEGKPKVKERRLGKKALEASNLPEDFKADLAERGIEYAVRGRKVTDKEADEIAKVYIEEGRLDELKSVILNTGNEIPGDVRTNMAVKFAKRALDEGNKATTQKDRDAYREDALDVFYMDMKQSTNQAQALQSKTLWSDVVATTPDLFVEYAKKEQRAQNDKRLQGRKEDIKTAQQVIEDYLKSKEFKQKVEKEAKTKYDQLLDQGKQSKERRERGKAKFADGLNKVVTSIGAKKNAVAENEMKPEWLEGVKEMADGLLDIGVGSTAQLMNKIKVALREYLSPTEIDKYQARIIKETNAEKRVKKPVKKKSVLTEKELNDLVDKLYAKMVGGNKAQIRALAKDYMDRLVEGGALDEQSFRDLFAKSIGLEHLRPEDEVKLRDMAEKLSDLRSIKNNLEDLFKKFVVLDLSIHQAKKKGDITPEMQKEYSELREEINTQVKEYNKSLDDARQANKEISDFFADPKTTSDLFSTFIQGNLLTPISLVTNVVANTTWLPFRGLKYAIANSLDMALSGIGAVKENLLKKYKDNPRARRLLDKLPDKERTYDLMGAARGYIPGFKSGTIEGIRQMKTGQLPEDAYIREISKSLHPLKSAINVIVAMKGEEKVRATKVFNDSVEAILGAPPEIMFRLLNLGDKPFRRAAERARLEEIAAIKGLKGAAKEAFMTFPDDNTLEEMRKAGLEATYQQDNVIANAILHGVKGKKVSTEALDKADKKLKGALRFLLKTQIPYVKTPTNIVIEAMDYAIPEISLAKSVFYATKGDRRKSLDYMSRAIVGYALEAALTSLFVAGLFTFAPQGLEEDESKKIRESEFAAEKLPYSVNSDALLRYITGEDSSFQEGDDLWSVKRFGIISAIMMGKMEAFRGKTPEEVAETTYSERRLGGYFPVVKSALDQSFVSGVNNLINAFMGSEYERMNWITGTARAIESSALPNTYAALNKWRDGYIRETKNRHLQGIERAKEDIKQDFKTSYLTPDDLPTKVSIWGVPVKRVPDGRGLGFVLFDITQSREYSRTFGMEVHELYERTRNKDVLPSQPSRKYKYKESEFMLPNKIYEDLQIRLNSINAQIIQPIVESQTWGGLTDEQKVFKIEQAYKKINSKKTRAKRQFEIEWKYELEELAEKEEK